MLKVGLVTRRPGQQDGPLVELLAVVDSGAYRTSLPLQIATDLGIASHELTEDPHGGFGVGSKFRIWTTTVPITAGVALFEPAPDGSVQAWGPGFAISPAFTEHNAFLLGREDFFRAFIVTFENTQAGQVFHLDTIG